jgi:hypothetical protein
MYIRKRRHTPGKFRQAGISFPEFAIFIVLIAFNCVHPVYGQRTEVTFKDSIDNRFDLSDWVLTANGFIPVPIIITEPAVGGFGGGIFALFIDPNSPYQDSVHGQVIKTNVKPNIYGAGGAYTANGTWVAGIFAQGVVKPWRANYRFGAAYANANLKFYKELPQVGEASFEFNLRTVPLFGQLIKQFGRSDWYAGLNYLFLKTELTRTNFEFHEPKDINSMISRPGLLVEYDKRDNIFTPNKGLRWNTLTSTSVEWLGSDYTYSSVNSVLYTWIPVAAKIYSGFRMEYQHMWGDAPFYMLPFINMRGIPVARYQGNSTVLLETEWRWDFTKRWSVVGFVGGGKAIQKESSFGDAPWNVAGGAGGRYLIARKLNLRAGLDVARGPETWAYYIVVGSYWLR